MPRHLITLRNQRNIRTNCYDATVRTVLAYVAEVRCQQWPVRDLRHVTS